MDFLWILYFINPVQSPENVVLYLQVLNTSAIIYNTSPAAFLGQRYIPKSTVSFPGLAGWLAGWLAA
jgi:hypothetical protein